MTSHFLLAIFDQVTSKPIVPKAAEWKAAEWKAAALVAGLAVAIFADPAHAVPTSGGDTVKGLYDALVGTMKSGRSLGQSGRFAHLEPVIRRTFDIPTMARLSVGSSWVTLSEAAAAGHRKLRALHLGNLCRSFRQLRRAEITGHRRTPSCCWSHGEEPDHQSEW